jgi:hypothetical protein
MFAVSDIDETFERLRKRGAQLVGEVIQYKKTRIGSATSAALKGFSSDSPKNSDEGRHHNAVRPFPHYPKLGTPTALFDLGRDGSGYQMPRSQHARP